MFENIIDKQSTSFDICPIELEGTADFMIHSIKEFHELLFLLVSLRYVLLHDFRINIEKSGFSSVEFELYFLLSLLSNTSIELLPVSTF
jgi:hypothetical protein